MALPSGPMSRSTSRTASDYITKAFKLPTGRYISKEDPEVLKKREEEKKLAVTKEAERLKQERLQEEAKIAMAPISAFAQELPKGIASLALSAFSKKEIVPDSPVAQTFLGKEKIKPMSERLAKYTSWGKERAETSPFIRKFYGEKKAGWLGGLALAPIGGIMETLAFEPGIGGAKRKAARTAVKRSLKKIATSTEDIARMEKYIDYARLSKKVDTKLEGEMSKVADKLKLPVYKTRKEQADVFDEYIQQYSKVERPITYETAISRKKAAARKLAQPEAAGAALGLEPEMDEKGRITGFGYDPAKGIAGLAGMTVGKRIKSKFEGVKSKVKVPQVFRSDKITLDSKGVEFVEEQRRKAGLLERGVRTHPEVKEAAQELGIDLKAILSSANKNRLTDVEVVALRNQVKRDSEEIIHLTKQIETDPFNKQTLIDRIGVAELRTQAALKKLVKGGTEAGRTISAYRIMAQDTMDPSFWLQRAQRTAGRELKPEELKALRKALDDKDQMALLAEMAKLQKSTTAEKMVTFWKAGLLTSPTTHMANIVSTQLMFAMEAIKDLPASLVDKAASVLTGKRALSFSIKGTGKGYKMGWQKAKNYLRTGITPEDAAKYDIRKQINYGDSKMGRMTQKYVDTVFRTLGAEDKVFREAALQKSLVEQAKNEASNLKLKGAEFDIKVKELWEEPTDEMFQNAINDAEYTTFLRKTAIGDLASGITAGAKRHLSRTGGDALGTAVELGVEVSVPFKQTPAAVATTILDYSPAGFITAVADGIQNKNQREFAQKMGRAITGTGLISLGGFFASNGLVTGAYPTDSKERVVWEQEGKLPNAVKINDYWVELSRLGILGALLGMGSDMQRAKTEGEDMFETAKAGVYSGLESFTEQSFMRGLNAGIEALTEPERYLEKFSQQLVTSIVPTFFARLAQVIDPTARDYKTLKDAFLRKVPFASFSAAEKIDKFGQLIKDERPFYARAIDRLLLPARVKKIDTKKTTQKLMEFYDTGVPVAPTQLSESTSLYGIKLQLHPTKVKSAQKEMGTYQLQILAKLMEKESFNKMTIEDQSDMVQDMFKDIYTDIKKEQLADEVAFKISKAIDSNDAETIQKVSKNNALDNEVVRKELTRLGHGDLFYYDKKKKHWKFKTD
jgi:hypothetical protein